MPPFQATFANVGSLWNAVGRWIEYNNELPETKRLDDILGAAFALYDVTRNYVDFSNANVELTDELPAPHKLVLTARNILHTIAILKEQDMPWANPSALDSSWPGVSGTPGNLSKHPKNMPSACIFSTAYLPFVDSLKDLSTDDRIQAIAEYMCDNEYYNYLPHKQWDPYTLDNALRHALLIHHFDDCYAIIQDAHKKNANSKKNYKDIFNFAEFPADCVLMAEAPGNDDQWTVLESYAPLDKYKHRASYAVDPKDPNENMIGVVSKLSFTNDTDVVKEWIHSFDNLYLYNPKVCFEHRFARTVVIVLDDYVLAMCHYRDTKDKTQGGIIAEWVHALHKRIANKYPTKKVFIGGDFNFPSSDMSSTAQDNLSANNLLFGNTSAPHVRHAPTNLLQVPSMLRFRTWLGSPQYSKCGQEKVVKEAKMNVALAKSIVQYKTYLRVVAYTMFAMAATFAITNSDLAAFLTALIVFSKTVATQTPTVTVHMNQDTDMLTPGPETPLDHKPVTVVVQEQSTDTELFKYIALVVGSIFYFAA